MLVLAAFVVAAFPALAQPKLTLAANGRSAYRIYRDPVAPPSVLRAAQELQRVIKASTGAELPLVDQPTTPMICLGDNASARAAGLDASKLPDDNFRWLTKNGSLYIAGKDLPNDQPPYRGWTSLGTLYGTYHFLEQAVGVRWLMPGDVGEEIPHRATLTIAPLNVQSGPHFPLRYLVDIQDSRSGADKGPNTPKEWLERQGIPTPTLGRKLDHGHAWDQYLTVDDWKAHPEWMAMDDQGKRRDFSARPAGVKYCTTNPELVQAFAAGVIKWLDAHPAWKSAPISPADGGDFCQCPNCKALWTKDPHGRDSVVVNILTFDNAVAKIVGQKYPDRPLPGYVYYNYMYPPSASIKMEPNVWLVLAPLNYYGMGLYKPMYRAEFASLIKGWLNVTKNFDYHNYSTWLRDFNGAPLPVARDILKLELPTIAAAGGQGVDMVGDGAWGYGAPTNYLYAKLMWNPKADVDKLYDEWMGLAYGPAAAPMKQLYGLIESRFRAYKQAENPIYRGDMYEINYEKVERIYLPIFGDMERLYKQAQALAATDKQKARLSMFGDNLVMLLHDMRAAGMAVPGAERSIFARTEEQYQQFLKDTEFSNALYRNAGQRWLGPVWKGEWNG